MIPFFTWFIHDILFTFLVPSHLFFLGQLVFFEHMISTSLSTDSDIHAIFKIFDNFLSSNAWSLFRFDVPPFFIIESLISDMKSLGLSTCFSKNGFKSSPRQTQHGFIVMVLQEFHQPHTERCHKKFFLNIKMAWLKKGWKDMRDDRRFIIIRYRW